MSNPNEWCEHTRRNSLGGWVINFSDSLHRMVCDDELYCSLCGKPRPEPKTRTCKACGKTIDSDRIDCEEPKKCPFCKQTVVDNPHHCEPKKEKLWEKIKDISICELHDDYWKDFASTALYTVLKVIEEVHENSSKNCRNDDESFISDCTMHELKESLEELRE